MCWVYFCLSRIVQSSERYWGKGGERAEAISSFLHISTAQLVQFVTVLRCRFSVRHLKILFSFYVACTFRILAVRNKGL